MNKSENINELGMDKIIPALIEIQKEVTNIFKGAQGYNYKYAKLDPILDMLRPLANKHDVLIWQDASGGDGNNITITTEFIHSSGQKKGESLNVSIPDLAKMNSLQSLGSTISYVRRYHLMMMIGICGTDDDDGKSGGDHIDESRKELISYMTRASTENSINHEIVIKALMHYGVKEIENLTTQQLQAIIARINKG